MASADDDLLVWDEDRVVQEVCIKSDSLFAGVPRRDQLEQPLRDNNITGEFLLDLTQDMLKNDLGLSSLGQRLAIMKAIRQLKGSNSAFTMEERIQRYQEGLQTPDGTFPRPSYRAQSLAYSGNEVRPSIEYEASHTAFNPPQPTSAQANQQLNSKDPTYGTAAVSRTLHPLLPNFPPPAADSIPGPQYKKITIGESKIGAAGSHTLMAPDAGAESAVSAVKACSIKRTESPDLLDVIEKTIDRRSPHQSKLPPASAATVSETQSSGLKPKKRIAPTFIKQLDSFSKASNDLVVPEPGSYYGKAAIRVQDNFYGPKPDSGPEFNFADAPRAPGATCAVAERLLRSWKQPLIQIPGTKLKAWTPYKASDYPNADVDELITVITLDGQVLEQRVQDYPNLRSQHPIHTHSEDVTAGYASQPQALDPFAIQETTDFTSELGALAAILERYPPEDDEDEALPMYGESEDEDAQDEEVWQAIQVENAEVPQISNSMTHSEVSVVIEEAMNDFELQWQQTKLPKVKVKAYKIWYKAANMKTRQPARDQTQASLQLCEARLVKLKEAIRTEIWHKAADVKALCQTLQETAYTIFECKHILEVLAQQVPPTKPYKENLKRPQKFNMVLPEGEEILTSEDDIEDFVVDESSLPGNIPYGPEEDFDPQLPASSPVVEETQRQPELTSSPPEEPQPQATVLDLTGDEADRDSDEDDEIISSVRPKRRSKVAMSPRKAKTTTRSIKGHADDASATDTENDEESNRSVDLDAPPKLPKTKYRHSGFSVNQAIDLTFSDPAGPSSSEFDVKTPPLNPGNEDAKSEPDKAAHKKTLGSPKQGQKHRERRKSDLAPTDDLEEKLPSPTDVKAMRKLSWQIIESNADNARALCKSVYATSEPEFTVLREYMETVRDWDDALKEGLLSLRTRDGRVRKVLSRHQPAAQLSAYLFMAYFCAKDIVKSNVASEQDMHTSYDNIPQGSKKFSKWLEKASQAYRQHLDSTTPARSTKRKANFKDSGLVDNGTDTDLLDSGTEEPAHSQYFKKRKREVKESQEAKANQRSDQQRVQEQEARRLAMEAKFKIMPADAQAQHFVNFQDPPVQLHPHISGRVKPHQVAGIRFLWREIVEDPKHKGCLLAHTMGLGKTMQVISLLVTIASCNRSEDPQIQAYIPEHLRKSRTLVLCPPSLLDNWYDEVVMWLPRNDPRLLGGLFKINSGNDSSIAFWASQGGVMIMSYDLFRGMLKPRKSKSVSEAEMTQRENWLLKAPTLVIADEAHKMKNAKSAIATLARRIETNSRIALTGSPLNNYLEEYHTMVDWIAPKYLGDILEFKAKYVEPIIQGLYAESTPYERRLCLKKLHVLKQDLAPKVNRADISAISKDLPSKTEYFITLPLTDLQRRAYDIYVGSMIKAYGTSGHTVEKGLFNLISILLWLCNHPSIFYKKYQQRHGNLPIDRGEETDTSDFESTGESVSSGDRDGPPNTDAAASNDIELSAMEEAVKVFDEVDRVGSLDDHRLSYRATLVRQLIQKAMDLGENVLLFSHSLDTLDYLQSMLNKLGCKYFRIDGKTDVKKRQRITKSFNTHPSACICLISTRAGGLGLNLQGASRVIIYDFGFNPMWEEQAIGRAYRLGQKQPVHVYRFRIGGTIEEVINNKSVFKTQLFSRVVDKRNPMRYASNKVSDYLFLSRDVELRNFEECRGKDPKVLDAILEEKHEIHNIEFTETFHREDDEQLNDEELKEANEEWARQRLQRDDPDAYNKKYGSQPVSSQTMSRVNGLTPQLATPIVAIGRNTQSVAQSPAARAQPSVDLAAAKAGPQVDLVGAFMDIARSAPAINVRSRGPSSTREPPADTIIAALENEASSQPIAAEIPPLPAAPAPESGVEATASTPIGHDGAQDDGEQDDDGQDDEGQDDDEQGGHAQDDHVQDDSAQDDGPVQCRTQ